MSDTGRRLFDKFKDARNWKLKADPLLFFGEPVSKFSHDELLATIGFLQMENDRHQQKAVQESAILSACAKLTATVKRLIVGGLTVACLVFALACFVFVWTWMNKP